MRDLENVIEYSQTHCQYICGCDGYVAWKYGFAYGKWIGNNNK